jgi:hypothetical protein
MSDALDKRIMVTHEKLQNIDRKCYREHHKDIKACVVDYFHVQVLHVCPECYKQVREIIKKDWGSWD